jgi:hypothetical protein
MPFGTITNYDREAGNLIDDFDGSPRRFGATDLKGRLKRELDANPDDVGQFVRYEQAADPFGAFNVRHADVSFVARDSTVGVIRSGRHFRIVPLAEHPVLTRLDPAEHPKVILFGSLDKIQGFTPKKTLNEA